MFVFRTAMKITLGMLALGTIGCEPSQGASKPGDETGSARSQADALSDDKPKTTVADSRNPDPLAEYRDREKTWCDDRPVEIQEENYPDGKPKYRYEVVMSEEGDFVRHGKSTTYWETGAKKLELYYVCGVKHGPKRTWWQDGSKWSVGGFFEGKDHGTWIVWDNRGLKSKQYRIVKGVWQGFFTAWHPNGKKRLEVEYVDGLRQGNLVLWDEHGNVAATIEYVDGKEQPMPGP